METNEKRYCVWCGNEIGADEDTYEYNGEDLCESCYLDEFTTCDYCYELVPCDESHYVEGHIVCDNCLDDNFAWCSECGRYVDMDNYNYHAEMCGECFEQTHEIPDYHSHDFYPIGTPNYTTLEFYKGVELEVDTNNYHINRRELIDDLDYEINRTQCHIVFENDGSLNHGVEIISHPHTIAEHNKINWKFILDTCREHGFKSHDVGTCGLHLHYSRMWFGVDTDTQDENIAKLILFYERFFSEFLKLSRRTDHQYKRWCDRYYTSHIKECTDVVKEKCDGRYRAVNVTKRSTIEFRLGRGTLKIESFNAWNDIHDCMVKNCKHIPLSNVTNVYMWLDGIKVETLQYIREKCAFVGWF